MDHTAKYFWLQLRLFTQKILYSERKIITSNKLHQYKLQYRGRRAGSSFPIAALDISGGPLASATTE
jgi:hypothetical protein